MRIIGVDFHAGQQTIAMFDTETKELVEKTLTHEGGQVREFYSALPRAVQVGIEARSLSENSSLLLLNSLEKECKCVRIIRNHGETIPILPSRTRFAFTSQPARMVAG